MGDSFVVCRQMYKVGNTTLLVRARESTVGFGSELELLLDGARVASVELPMPHFAWLGPGGFVLDLFSSLLLGPPRWAKLRKRLLLDDNHKAVRVVYDRNRQSAELRIAGIRQQPMTPEAQAREYIRRYLRYGFYQPGEIARSLYDEGFEGAIPQDRVRQMIAEEMDQQKAQEKFWPSVSDCDHLDRVFETLNAAGILALHNTTFDAMCMVARYNTGIIGYCFYHRPDLESLENALKSGELQLAYGHVQMGDPVKGTDIGHRICRELERAGLKVTWSGLVHDPLVIKPFRWQRRSENWDGFDNLLL